MIRGWLFVRASGRIQLPRTSESAVDTHEAKLVRLSSSLSPHHGPVAIPKETLEIS